MKETTKSVRSNAQEGVPHEKGVLGLKVKKLCKDGSKDVPLIHLQHNEATEGGGGMAQLASQQGHPCARRDRYSADKL